jgi:hypothetical protein
MSAMRLLLSILLPVSVVVAAEPSFRVVSATDEAALEHALDSSGADGYRLVAAGEGLDVSGVSRVVVLLRRSFSPCRYKVVASSGDLTAEAADGVIAAAAAEGYRLRSAGVVARGRPGFFLPESQHASKTSLIFERDDAAGTWSYVGVAFRDPDSFESDLAGRWEAGFDVVGLWNTGRKLEVLLERDARATSARTSGSGQYRLLLLATRKVLLSKMNGAADRGYRVVAAEEPPTAGPPILLMRRAGPADARIDYGFAKNLPQRLDRGDLAARLDKLSSSGWRVVPDGVTHDVLALERAVDWSATKSEGPRHRVVSSGRVEELAASLEQAERDGYRFLHLFVEPSRTSVLLVQER